ncbi:speriolin-like protein [Mixophyes fleayi]|uniref:speriolin-like protein n=1 Tax=Mixophyes fleayi TaxID=3061075 RepID=UPI003F4D93D4
MSSEASTNILQSREFLQQENTRLLNENGELRNLVALLQENLELRCSVREHESRARSLSPRRKQQQEEKNTKETKESKYLMDGKSVKESKHLKETKKSKDSRDLKDSVEKPIEPETTQLQDTAQKSEEPEATQLQDTKKLQHSQRIVGEIAFQLDRRILSAVFFEQSRLYGFRVANIEEKIIQVSTCTLSRKINEKRRSELDRRYKNIMERLGKLGYDHNVHAPFGEYLVNIYGIMKERPVVGTKELACLNDLEFLRKVVNECMPIEMVKAVHLLLNCLVCLANEDGKCLFNWY